MICLIKFINSKLLGQFNFKCVKLGLESSYKVLTEKNFLMSKKRKGLSLEEKRDKLLEVYYEKKEVLNLKEVEKWGAKKGVVL